MLPTPRSDIAYCGRKQYVAFQEAQTQLFFVGTVVRFIQRHCSLSTNGFTVIFADGRNVRVVPVDLGEDFNFAEAGLWRLAVKLLQEVNL